jgi:NADPH2:quinone reductase
MRAIVCKQFGPLENLVLEERPTQLPGPGEIAIAVHGVGVNYADVLAIEGRSQLKRSPPIVPGVELSGVGRIVLVTSE